MFKLAPNQSPKPVRLTRSLSWRRLLLGALFWMPMSVFMVMIIQSSIPYFLYPSTDPFFTERPELSRDLLWRACFYVHICGSTLVLLSAGLQFSKTLLRRFPSVHRWQGRLYVWSALVVAVPTGFYLAWYAKGGALGRIGFALQATLLFYTTWKGLVHIMRGDLKRHVAWMTRSFSIACTAISFRLWYVGLYYAGFADINANYTAAIWLSTAFNLVVCEAWLAANASRNRNPNPKPS